MDPDMVDEWYAQVDPNFHMTKDFQVDKQIHNATAPTRHKPHASRDQERIRFVARVLHDYQWALTDVSNASVEDYMEIAEVAIDAVKEFAGFSSNPAADDE